MKAIQGTARYRSMGLTWISHNICSPFVLEAIDSQKDRTACAVKCNDVPAAATAAAAAPEDRECIKGAG